MDDPYKVGNVQWLNQNNSNLIKSHEYAECFVHEIWYCYKIINMFNQKIKSII